jgi:hypothetical protein
VLPQRPSPLSVGPALPGFPSAGDRKDVACHNGTKWGPLVALHAILSNLMHGRRSHAADIALGTKDFS